MPGVRCAGLLNAKSVRRQESPLRFSPKTSSPKKQASLSYLFAGIAAILFGGQVLYNGGFHVAGSFFPLQRGSTIAGVLFSVLGAYWIYSWVHSRFVSCP